MQHPRPLRSVDWRGPRFLVAFGQAKMTLRGGRNERTQGCASWPCGCSLGREVTWPYLLHKLVLTAPITAPRTLTPHLHTHSKWSPSASRLPWPSSPRSRRAPTPRPSAVPPPAPSSAVSSLLTRPTSSPAVSVVCWGWLGEVMTSGGGVGVVAGWPTRLPPAVGAPRREQHYGLPAHLRRV